MKKIFLILGLLSVIACQDETTDKTPQAPNVYQGVFLDGNNTVEVYVQEYQDNKIQNLKVKLIRAAGKIVSAQLIITNSYLLINIVLMKMLSSILMKQKLLLILPLVN